MSNLKGAVVARRAVGNTGVEASILGFGTGDNAGLMVFGSRADQQRAVREAMQGGINYFDTSPDYGLGRAEENLGRALKGVRQDVLITSKVEIMPADQCRLAKKVVASVDESLQRLNTDYLDFLQIHNHPTKANNWDRVIWTPLIADDFTREGGALDGLAQVIAAGKVRFGGIACEHADPDVVAALVSQPTVHILNVWLNMLNPSALLPMTSASIDGPEDYRGIAAAAATHNVGIAGFRAMGGGSLMSAAARTLDRHPLAAGGYSRRPAEWAREVSMATRLVDKLGIGSTDEMAALAYRFNITDPRVFTTVGGYSELSHLQGAIAAVARGPLSDHEMKSILDLWATLYANGSEVT